MDVSQRLFRVIRSIAEDKFETISRLIDGSSERFDERLRSWEAEFDIDEDDPFASNQSDQQNSGYQTETNTPRDQFREDLQLFGLTPPSSLDEVRQVRNRELKKFHPDKYLDQPEKLETAKQIVQIYNTAYDRLKRNFGRERDGMEL